MVQTRTHDQTPHRLGRAKGLLARWQALLLVLIGFLTAGMYAAFFFVPLLDPPHAEKHVQWSLLLFALYLPVVAWAPKISKGRLLGTLVAFTLLFRLLLWPHDPSMSDDAFRYIWDGKIQAQGFNPYEEAPNSLYLLHLRDSIIHPFINHPHLKTVYPPVAQAIFTIAYLLHPQGFLGLKLLLLLFEIAACVLLWRWIRRHGRPPGLLLLYLWCPLPILELSLDGHLDGFALPFLVALLCAAQEKRGFQVGLFLALAILVKPLPIFLVPVLFWHLRWKQSFQMLLSALVLGLCIMLPYLQEWITFLKQIAAYSRDWYFNGPLYTLLDIWLVKPANRAILQAIVLLFALVSAFWKAPLRWRLFVPLAAYMLFTPTLYPWYLLWLAPWLVLAPSRLLIGLMGLLPISHLVHAFKRLEGVWYLPLWIMLLEFLPLLWLLAMDIYQARRYRGLLRFRLQIPQSPKSTRVP
ncbi:MAG: hypothetical protein H6728_17715 [Myxococcales bacterium]|nr:hypothetical protein [Myxococcales bacterium]